MSNVKNITRDRSKTIPESELDSSSCDSILSIPSLVKAAKNALEEDVKGKFDAAMSGDSHMPASPAVEDAEMVNSTPQDVEPDAAQAAKDDERKQQAQLRRNQRPKSLVDYLSVATRNGYSVLTEESLDDAVTAPMDTTPPDAAAQDEHREEQTSQSHRKNQKPPPICFPTRMEEHYWEFRARLDAISRDYYQQFSGNKTLVYYKTLSAYKKFIATYRGKLPFYTFTPRAERTFAYVIKGLHGDVAEDDLKTELTDLGIPVRTVEKFRKTKNPIYMMTVLKGTTLKDVCAKARYLQRTRVYIEAHINKKTLTQCKKCQDWGHATTNCYLNEVRCVKCAKAHRSFECPDTESTGAVKCCNCGGSHPASSTECPKYLKALETRQRRQQPSQKGPKKDQVRFVPAPPPKINAWSQKEFPSLPSTSGGRNPEQTSRNNQSTPRNRTPDVTDLDSDADSDDWQKPRPSPFIGRGASRGARGSALRGRGGRSHSRDGRRRSQPMEREKRHEDSQGTHRDTTPDINQDQRDMQEIADTMREINNIVDIKRLNARLKKLLVDLKKCTTPFEHAMAISDFNDSYGH